MVIPVGEQPAEVIGEDVVVRDEAKYSVNICLPGKDNRFVL